MDIPDLPDYSKTTELLRSDSMLARELAGLVEDFGQRYMDFPDKSSLYGLQLGTAVGLLLAAAIVVDSSEENQSGGVLLSANMALLKIVFP